MKRRQILAGFTGLAAGSGLFVGSSAFTSVQADRSVRVDTARDSDAFLRLVEVGPGERSDMDDGKLEFAIPGDDEADYNSNDPVGVGTDSIYKFDRDAGSDEPGLFEVQNQGTQDVRIWGSQPRQESEDGNKLPKVDIFDVETGEILTEENPSRLLSPGGDPLIGGIQIDTHDVEIRNEAYNFEITIHGAVNNE